MGGAENEKLSQPDSHFSQSTKETKSDDAIMYHHFRAIGYHDFQYGRYGDPHGKNAGDRRTRKLAYHVKGTIGAADGTNHTANGCGSLLPL